MSSSSPIDRYRDNLQAEIDAILLYDTMADVEPKPQLAEIYRRLSKVEEKHARFWEEELKKAGVVLSPRQPTFRAKFKAWLARRMGPQLILPTLAATEREGRGMYDNQPEAAQTDLPGDERSHARILSTMVRHSTGGAEGGLFAHLEGRHRAIGGNALRAAVLGANDGLLSNLSLVMGVAGAQMTPRTVLVTGAAGLLAGAFSMAIGEWVSVQSSRELNESQLRIEEEELRSNPESEQEELALIYESKGLPKEEATQLAKRLMENKEKALETLAREELGIDPSDLGGSSWVAAITSFLLFSIGAIVPVVPFLFLPMAQALVTSLIVSATGLFGIGAGITLVTGLSPWKSGMRQLLLGLAAAAITYGIGHLLGVQLTA